MHVIGVLMRNENSGQAFRRASDGAEPFADLSAAEAGINENSRFGSFDVSAIARGAAPKNRQLNCHGATVKIRSEPGNIFSAASLRGKARLAIYAQPISLKLFCELDEVFESRRFNGV